MDVPGNRLCCFKCTNLLDDERPRRDMNPSRITAGMANQVKASHILVNDEATAKRLLERLQKGEDFAALAKQFSCCPSKRNGGDLGWFKRGQMVREFEDAAFRGAKGAVVGPVKTDFGWHLIKILDSR